MSRRWLLSLSCLAVLFLTLVQLTRAGGELRVDETGCSISFRRSGASFTRGAESVDHQRKRKRSARLLDPRDRIVAKITQVQSIARAARSSNFRCHLPFKVRRQRT